LILEGGLFWLCAMPWQKDRFENGYSIDSQPDQIIRRRW
jgi:hypothetical protein